MWLKSSPSVLFAARAAVRDVGRALRMPYSAVDGVAKKSPKARNVS